MSAVRHDPMVSWQCILGSAGHEGAGRMGGLETQDIAGMQKAGEKYRNIVDSFSGRHRKG